MRQKKPSQRVHSKETRQDKEEGEGSLVEGGGGRGLHVAYKHT